MILTLKLNTRHTQAEMSEMANTYCERLKKTFSTEIATILSDSAVFSEAELNLPRFSLVKTFETFKDILQPWIEYIESCINTSSNKEIQVDGNLPGLVVAISNKKYFSVFCDKHNDYKKHISDAKYLDIESNNLVEHPDHEFIWFVITLDITSICTYIYSQLANKVRNLTTT